MSSKKEEKLNQVVQNYFNKAVNMIVRSRSPIDTLSNDNYGNNNDDDNDNNNKNNSNNSNNNSTNSNNDINDNDKLTENKRKINKWFNIETNDLPQNKIKQWRIQNNNQFVPIVVEIYLDLRALSLNQSLVLRDENGISYNVNTNKSEIVMERWLIEFDTSVKAEREVDEQLRGEKDLEDELEQHTARGRVGDDDDELPFIYKRLIILFRYLFTTTKLLPTYKLLKKLSKMELNSKPSIRVGSRILDANKSIVSKGRIGLSKPIVLLSPHEDHLVQNLLTPIKTSCGTFKISLSYRKHYDFILSDNEETLSSHFINIDKTRSRSSSIQFKKIFRSGNSPSNSPPIEEEVKPVPVVLSSLDRNGSNTSLIQNLRNQRGGSTTSTSIPKSLASSIGSIAISAPIHAQQQKHHQQQQQLNSHTSDLSSGGSIPKYSSSFGKVARRSSIRRSSSMERGFSSGGTPSSLKNQQFVYGSNAEGANSDQDLDEFVKLLDSRQDLKLKFSPNINDSLGKFQLMKSKNDFLSDSLSASLYSKSQSPPPSSSRRTSLQKQRQLSQQQIQRSPRSITPVDAEGVRTGEINSSSSSISNSNANSNPQPIKFNSPVPPSVSNFLTSSVSPRSTNYYLPAIPSRLLETNSSSESLLLNEPQQNSISNSNHGLASNPLSRVNTSSSPSSVGGGRRSFSIGPSNPSIVSSNIHAVIQHRIKPNETISSLKNKEGDQNDDDDLLFTMSDMNLSK